ncbi:amino acid adenylation domain-containing protein [Kitasatospora arboriphila]|uniref:Amino acid adenylation domain-containing protein n=1 Tax=Kitasatospora arboriphila TaxID=258052 RepID=A0ABN1THK9_9ACTN
MSPDLAELPLADGAAARAAALGLRNRREQPPLGLGVLAHAARHAAAEPAAPAVVDGGSVIGYAELVDRAAHLRDALAAAGTAAGDVVAEVGDRTADTVVVFLALEDLGAVYLPIDPDWPARRVADVLTRSGADRLLDYCAPTGDGPRAPAAARAAGETGVPVLPLPAYPGAAAAGPAAAADERDRSLEPRYCIFTSGTTGRPKGALVEHRGMMNHLRAKVDDLGLTAGDRLAFTAPLVFDISIWQMLAPLLVGGTVVVVRQEELAFPPRLVRLLERTGTAVVELVPTVVGWIADAAERRPGTVLPQLRWLISTGEELHPGLAARMLAAAPHVRLLNAYGPTECSDDITHHEVTAADLDRPRLPVGAPVANAALYLLVHEPEQDAWRAAEPDEAGELFVGGVVVGLGYLNDPENSGRAFHRDALDPGSPTGRLYRTGDLARFERGRVQYLGRVDRQVKVAGVRMELDEIEVVLRSHPAVDQCAVTVPVVAGRPELAAHVTLRTAAEPEELRTFLAGALPEAMVPRQVTVLDAMPLTRNGKTDHRALQQLTVDAYARASV